MRVLQTIFRILMRVLQIIFGILMIIGGCICLFTPLGTALEFNYFIVIMSVVYGILGICASISNKYYGASFVFSILSVIFGIALLCLPRLMAMSIVIWLYCAAAWFVVEGVFSIVNALSVRKYAASKGWVFQLIFGILSIILGVYSFFHPMLFGMSVAWVVGTMVGAFFIMTGFSMIFFTTKSK